MSAITHALLYDVDWAAVSTIVLTVITGYYAWSTRQILIVTSRQAKIAEENLRLLLLERSQRLGHHSAPLRRVAAAGLKLVDEWQAYATEHADWTSPPAGEPEEFFASLQHARALSPALHERLVAVQNCIVRLRVASDAVRTAAPDKRMARLREVHDAVSELRRVWRDADEEAGRLETL